MSKIIFALFISFSFFCFGQVDDFQRLKQNGDFSINPPPGKNGYKFKIFFHQSKEYHEVEEEIFVVETKAICTDPSINACYQTEKRIFTRAAYQRFIKNGIFVLKDDQRSDFTGQNSFVVKIRFQFFSPYLCNWAQTRIGKPIPPHFDKLKPINPDSIPTYYNQGDMSWTESTVFEEYKFFYDPITKVTCFPIYQNSIRGENVDFIGMDFSMIEHLKTDQGIAKQLRLVYNLTPLFIAGGAGTLAWKISARFIEKFIVNEVGQILTGIGVSLVAGFLAVSYSQPHIDNFVTPSPTFELDEGDYKASSDSLKKLIMAMERTYQNANYISPEYWLRTSEYTEFGIWNGQTKNSQLEGENVRMSSPLVNRMDPNTDEQTKARLLQEELEQHNIILLAQRMSFMMDMGNVECEHVSDVSEYMRALKFCRRINTSKYDRTRFE